MDPIKNRDRWSRVDVAMAELASVRRTDYSDNSPLAMQRRYHMPQRSPLIFWLLLAATIAVDAAAYVWLLSVGSTLSVRASDAYLGFDALVAGQFSIACVWSALSIAKTTWVRIVPWLAVLVRLALKWFATAWNSKSTSSEWLHYWGLRVELPEYLFCAALLMLALWLFERTPFWRNRTKTKCDWQFSLGQILIITTVVAILVVCMCDNSWFFGDDYGLWLRWAWPCSSVVLALAAIMAWSFSWHWLMQLAIVQAVALALGAFFGYYNGGDLGFHVERQIAYYTIQALVLSIWLGIGPVLPPRIDADAMQNSEPVVPS